MDLDVSGGGEEALNLEDVRKYLRRHIQQEAQVLYGLTDQAWIEKVTNNWFSDETNYDGRWAVIKERAAGERRILDMAAGCGTFMLYGLRNGFDVWGIEPEEWKREYFRQKVEVSGYPEEFLRRLVPGVGEALPFDNATFDLVVADRAF